MSKQIEKLLPGYGCGTCGFEDCRAFGNALETKKAEVRLCPFMGKPIFKDSKDKIDKFLNNVLDQEPIITLLDKKDCDFVLAPLENESSCREFILPLVSKKVKIGDYLKWRPLGCPITHFGTVFEISPLIGVHPERSGKEFIDVGIAMVLAFEGTIVKGRVPEIQETVIFLPEYCMMQKSHSGIVVEVIGNKIRIEGIHLAVWNKS